MIDEAPESTAVVEDNAAEPRRSDGPKITTKFLTKYERGMFATFCARGALRKRNQ